MSSRVNEMRERSPGIVVWSWVEWEGCCVFGACPGGIFSGACPGGIFSGACPGGIFSGACPGVHFSVLNF